MKQIILFTMLTALCFLLFAVTLLVGFMKKKRSLKWTSVFFLFLFFGLSALAGFKFVTKSYKRVTETFKPRSGDEIYDALFDKRQTNCVKVIHYQDQVIPKIDYAIWLHFETCPDELKRILSRYEFSRETLPSNAFAADIPYGETIDWFNPKAMADTIIVYEYSTNDSRRIQTLWTTPDSTKVFCRDIWD